MGVTIDKATRDVLIKALVRIFGMEKGDGKDKEIKDFTLTMQRELTDSLMKETKLLMVDFMFESIKKH